MHRACQPKYGLKFPLLRYFVDYCWSRWTYATAICHILTQLSKSCLWWCMHVDWHEFTLDHSMARESMTRCQPDLVLKQPHTHSLASWRWSPLFVATANIMYHSINVRKAHWVRCGTASWFCPPVSKLNYSSKLIQNNRKINLMVLNRTLMRLACLTTRPLGNRYV